MKYKLLKVLSFNLLLIASLYSNKALSIEFQYRDTDYTLSVRKSGLGVLQTIVDDKPVKEELTKVFKCAPDGKHIMLVYEDWGGKAIHMGDRYKILTYFKSKDRWKVTFDENGLYNFSFDPDTHAIEYTQNTFTGSFRRPRVKFITRKYDTKKRRWKTKKHRFSI